MENKPVKTADSWESLRAFTAARIALGRVGESIPLSESLQFKLAHAHARDAVYSSLDVSLLSQELTASKTSFLILHSQAETREQYLQRPDLGRLLHTTSREIVKDNAIGADICIILADGLSAHAINTNALPLLEALLPLFKGMNYTISPICLAEQARVALADPIAYGLQCKLAIVLIGERPGLSAADSIGAYLTYDPKPGLTDERRNCVSNIRPEGLSFDLAARKIFYLVQEALKRKLSGVELKDNDRLLS
jgi:ethanolamine ammonia-lyase small subunit